MKSGSPTRDTGSGTRDSGFGKRVCRVSGIGDRGSGIGSRHSPAESSQLTAHSFLSGYTGDRESGSGSRQSAIGLMLLRARHLRAGVGTSVALFLQSSYPLSAVSCQPGEHSQTGCVWHHPEFPVGSFCQKQISPATRTIDWRASGSRADAIRLSKNDTTNAWITLTLARSGRKVRSGGNAT